MRSVRTIVESALVWVLSIGAGVAASGQVISSGTDFFAYCTWPGTCPTDYDCTYKDEPCSFCSIGNTEGDCLFAFTTDCNWAIWAGTNGCGVTWSGTCPGAGVWCSSLGNLVQGGWCQRFACWTVE